MTKVSKQIKILSVNPGINFCGGVESYSMNYYRNFNRDKIKMDFAVHDKSDLNYESEIINNGDKVFVFPRFTIKNFLKITKQLDLFFKNNHYDIIHCNMANASLFYFYYAKKYNIKIRILHSHQNKYADKKFNAIRNVPLIWIGKKIATHYLACSKEAGDFLFKKKNYDIIQNAIDIRRYKYSEEKRKKTREILNLNDSFVIGHIGRFEPVKNHEFILKIFKEIKKIHPNSNLVLVGSGSLKNVIDEKIDSLDLKSSVKLIGDVKNTEDYYCAMDLFLFPSLYEGLGIVAIEAQVSGLPIVCTNTLSKNIDVTENVCRISLKKEAKDWAKEILKKLNFSRKDCSEIFKNSCFNIINESSKLEKYYAQVLKDVK